MVPVLLRPCEISTPCLSQAARIPCSPYTIPDSPTASWRSIHSRQVIPCRRPVCSYRGRPCSAWDWSNPPDAGRIKPEAVPLKLAKAQSSTKRKARQLAERLGNTSRSNHRGNGKADLTALRRVRGVYASLPRPRLSQPCAACILFVRDSRPIGPNLTTYQRTDLENMLFAIVIPCAQSSKATKPIPSNQSRSVP